MLNSLITHHYGKEARKLCKGFHCSFLISPIPPAFEYIQARISPPTPHMSYRARWQRCLEIASASILATVPVMYYVLKINIFVHYTKQNLSFFSLFFLPILVPSLYLFCDLSYRRMTVSWLPYEFFKLLRGRQHRIRNGSHQVLSNLMDQELPRLSPHLY